MRYHCSRGKVRILKLSWEEVINATYDIKSVPAVKGLVNLLCKGIAYTYLFGVKARRAALNIYYHCVNLKHGHEELGDYEYNPSPPSNEERQA